MCAGCHHTDSNDVACSGVRNGPVHCYYYHLWAGGHHTDCINSARGGGRNGPVHRTRATGRGARLPERQRRRAHGARPPAPYTATQVNEMQNKSIYSCF